MLSCLCKIVVCYFGVLFLLVVSSLLFVDVFVVAVFDMCVVLLVGRVLVVFESCLLANLLVFLATANNKQQTATTNNNNNNSHDHDSIHNIQDEEVEEHKLSDSKVWRRRCGGGARVGTSCLFVC